VPLHTVRVDSFFIAKTEVTNQQYCDFLNSALAKKLVRLKDGLVYAADGTTLWCDTQQSDPASSIQGNGAKFNVVENRASTRLSASAGTARRRIATGSAPNRAANPATIRRLGPAITQGTVSACRRKPSGNTLPAAAGGTVTRSSPGATTRIIRGPTGRTRETLRIGIAGVDNSGRLL